MHHDQHQRSLENTPDPCEPLPFRFYAQINKMLAEGIEKALRQTDGVPLQRRTDKDEWTARSQTLVAHEHGDVEPSHRRFKEAVDQALRARWFRNVLTRAAGEHVLQKLRHQRSRIRAEKFAVETVAWRPLSSQERAPCKERHMVVSRASPSRWLPTTLLSLPPRLIDATVLMCMRLC